MTEHSWNEDELNELKGKVMAALETVIDPS